VSEVSGNPHCGMTAGPLVASAQGLEAAQGPTAAWAHPARCRRLLGAHPWAAPVLLGIALWPLSALVGATLLVVGLTALVGSRHAREKLALRRAGMAHIDVMDGTAFELYLATLLAGCGYRVRHVGHSGDFGADLVVEKDGGSAVVQAKRYVKNVGVEAVREATAARAYYGTAGAIVLTNSGFTRNAVTLAECNDVTLWGRDMLFSMSAQAYPAPYPSGMALFARELLAGLRTVVVTSVVLLLAATFGSKRRWRWAKRW